MSEMGVIVGSGFTRSGFEIVDSHDIETPYGRPSAPVLTVVVAGHELRCLARHGTGHSIAPHEINYRANIWALHRCGVRRIVALNAVGSIAEDFPPGELAVPDQLIDYTSGRETTFGGPGGGVVHVELTLPFDAALCAALAEAIRATGQRLHTGTYGVTQGPRLETAAEIDRLERDGCAMVGMTAMPEAALARELAVAYALCAYSVNYAAGRPAGAGPLLGPLLGQIEANLEAGMGRAMRALERLLAAGG